MAWVTKVLDPSHALEIVKNGAYSVDNNDNVYCRFCGIVFGHTSATEMKRAHLVDCPYYAASLTIMANIAQSGDNELNDA